MKIHRALSVLAFACLAAPPARAQLVQCNGVWTNQACEGAVAQQMNEQKTPDAPDDRLRSVKKSMVHEVSMHAIRIREETGVRMDVSQLEDYCLRPSTAIEECQSR